MKQKNSLLLIIVIIIGLAGVIAGVHFLKQPPKTAESNKPKMYHCPMHPTIISDTPKDCPICGMHLVPINDDHGSANSSSTAENHDNTTIKIDPTMVQNMGVTTTVVEMKSLKKEIRTSATLEYSETGVSIVNTKVMGYVEKLFIDFTGQSVKKGQPLLIMYSPELVNTQEEYIQALHYSQGLSGGSELARKGAQDLLESAKRRLQNWDISENQIEVLAQQGTAQKTITIYAPSNGVVMEKMVVNGQKIEPGMPLYKLADLSKIWAMANIYQDDLSYVKLGMKAQISLSSMPGKTFDGKVQFISPILDEISKTAKVRIEIPNTSDYTLKPQMFASVTILSPVALNGIAIPEQAVLHSGTRSVVIISLGEGSFKPKEIITGASANGYVQVLDGLNDGEVIVTSSQFLIDSESNLRAAVNSLANKPQHSDSSTAHDYQTTVPHDHGSNTMQEIENAQSKQSESMTEKSVVYFCPMDQEVVSDVPGKCPKCGMNLIKKE